jgi:hypothetical protein
MKSIFNAADSAEFIERIDHLTPATPALWGKMSVSQMLAHCQPFLQIAIGDLKLKRAFIGLIFGKIAKNKILKDEFLQKNLPTLKEAVIKDERNFEEEKTALKNLVIRVQKLGKEGLTKESHPFFGKLTPDEWDQLNTKHLDHHLRQFGV